MRDWHLQLPLEFPCGISAVPTLWEIVTLQSPLPPGSHFAQRCTDSMRDWHWITGRSIPWFFQLYRLYERSPLLLSDIPRLSDFFMTWHHYRKSGSPKKTIRCFCHPNRKSYRFSLYIILLFRFKTKKSIHVGHSFTHKLFFPWISTDGPADKRELHTEI